MPTDRVLMILLACGLILTAAAHYAPRVALLLAIAATVLGGVVLVLELVAS